MKKELTEQQVLDVLDCCMNSKSEVECRTCPLRGSKAGQCKSLAHNAIAHHIRKVRMQHTALYTSLQEMEEKDPDRKYGVRAIVKNGVIYAKTCQDYDNLIGDISRATVEEMINEISSRIWKTVPDRVNIPFDGRFVTKEEFISLLRISGGLE